MNGNLHTRLADAISHRSECATLRDEARSALHRCEAQIRELEAVGTSKTEIDCQIGEYAAAAVFRRATIEVPLSLTMKRDELRRNAELLETLGLARRRLSANLKLAEDDLSAASYSVVQIVESLFVEKADARVAEFWRLRKEMQALESEILGISLIHFIGADNRLRNIKCSAMVGDFFVSNAASVRQRHSDGSAQAEFNRLVKDGVPKAD